MAPNSAQVQLLKTPANIQKIVDQGVKIEVQWSPNDGVILPAQNSQWPSGSVSPDPVINKQVASSIQHLTIYTNSGVIAETIRFLGT